MVHFINHREAKQILDNQKDGTIFTVKFIKRSDKTLRTMNCRKGVRKGVKGVGMGYNPEKKNLVPVYDVQKAKELKNAGDTENKAFRMISVEGIREMTVKGQEYIVR
jgi:hypothetical protein